MLLRILTVSFFVLTSGRALAVPECVKAGLVFHMLQRLDTKCTSYSLTQLGRQSLRDAQARMFSGRPDCDLISSKVTDGVLFDNYPKLGELAATNNRARYEEAYCDAIASLLTRAGHANVFRESDR
jgi:hypothetical protein